MHRRRAAALAGLALVLVVHPSARAGEDAGAAPSSAPRRRLDLGPYGRPSPAQSTLHAPRFESAIEVFGHAPRDYNASMAVHWRQWELSTGSIYGKGINFQNQGCPTCVNVLPLVEKVVKKIKGRD